MGQLTRNRYEMLVRNCFLVLLCMGLLLIAIGVVVIPILPIFQLDRVLTLEELHDPVKSQATFALLKHAQGNQKLLWIIAGVAVVSVSGVGLWGMIRLKWDWQPEIED